MALRGVIDLIGTATRQRSSGEVRQAFDRELSIRTLRCVGVFSAAIGVRLLPGMR